MPDEALVPISGKLNDEVVWTPEYVQYGITRLALDEVTDTRFFAKQTNVSFFPGRNDYAVLLSGPEGQIDIKLASYYRIGHAGKFEPYSKLMSLTQKLIYPHIIKRYLTRIFVNGDTVEMRPIRMNRLGTMPFGN